MDNTLLRNSGHEEYVPPDVSNENSSMMLRQRLSHRERILLCVLAGYILGIALLTRHYVMDDAYIGFRYVDNFLNGAGITYNPGERVEGVTNIGWLLVLAPVALVMPVPVAAKVIGIILLLGVTGTILAVTRRLCSKAVDPAFLWPSVVLAATQFDLLWFTLLGMETAALAFGICVLVWLALCGRLRWWTGALGAYLGILHSEAVLVFPLAVLISCGIRAPMWRRHLPALFVFLAGILVVTGFRYVYFGDLLPNTFHSKPLNALKAFAGAFGYFGDTFYKSYYATSNVPNVFKGLFALPVMAWGLRSVFQQSRTGGAMVASTVVVGLTFSVVATRDWSLEARYFAPYAPVATVLLWRGIVDLVRKVLDTGLLQRWQPYVLFGLALPIVGINVGKVVIHSTSDYEESYPGFVLYGKNLVETATWIRDSLPHDVTVATFRIGAVGFYSGKRIFDYKFGLPHRDVARLVGAQRGLERGSGIKTPGDPALREIWQRRRPEYLLEDGVKDLVSVHGDVYEPVKTFRIASKWDWTLYKRRSAAVESVQEQEGTPSRSGMSGESLPYSWPVARRVQCGARRLPDG